MLVWSRSIGLRYPTDPHWGLTFSTAVPGCNAASSGTTSFKHCLWTTERSCLHAMDAVVIADLWDDDLPPKYASVWPVVGLTA